MSYNFLWKKTPDLGMKNNMKAWTIRKIEVIENTVSM